MYDIFKKGDKMDLKNKKVLVTGAEGFIGSHLVERLVNDGAKVRAFIHYNSRNDWGMLEMLPAEIKKKVEAFSGDTRDPFLCKKATEDMDVVFHLASLIAIPYSYLAPASYVQVNVLGTLNILQGCLENNVKKIVHTSTSETYGTARYVPIDEKHPLQAQSPYSASKIGADKIAESYFLSFGLPVATIRPFNTFGPRQSARAVIPTIITQALMGDTIKIGSTFPVRDLVYVKDNVDGYVRIAQEEKTVGQVINIGRGYGISVGQIIEMVEGILGKKLTVIIDKSRIRPRKSEVGKLICDSRKARRMLGWKCKYTLEGGLEETVGWIRDHLSFYKTQLYNL